MSLLLKWISSDFLLIKSKKKKCSKEKFHYQQDLSYKHKIILIQENEMRIKTFEILFIHSTIRISFYNKSLTYKFINRFHHTF